MHRIAISNTTEFRFIGKYVEVLTSTVSLGKTKSRFSDREMYNRHAQKTCSHFINEELQLPLRLLSLHSCYYVLAATFCNENQTKTCTCIKIVHVIVEGNKFKNIV